MISNVTNTLLGRIACGVVALGLFAWLALGDTTRLNEVTAPSCGSVNVRPAADGLPGPNVDRETGDKRRRLR
jgi:hypothetical protein